MKKNQWMLSIFSILFCVIAVLAYPTQTKAASQSGESAYRAIFDASYYYNSYSDVAAVCGTDENALYEHYINFGIYEGRSCSAAFNPQVYRQRYTDLQEAFGNDMAAYCQHYVFHGRSEGRDASAGGQAAAPVSGSAATSRVSIRKNTQTVEKSEEKQEVKTETSKVEEKKTETKTKTAKVEEKKTESKTKTSKVEEKKTESKTKTAKVEEKKTETKTKTAKATEKKETKIENKAKSTETAMNIKSTEEILATELPEASISETDVKMVKSAATEKKSAEQKSKRQVIGTYTTEYEDNISRAVNVELAAERINGVKLQPGEKFSFSNTILERTAENGYVNGPVFVKGKEVQGIGGGVCQVSSTLYAAMVDAGLKATERHAHSMPVDYVPQNLDATIAGDYLDLKFTNTFSQTLLIEAQAENGTLTVTLVLE